MKDFRSISLVSGLYKILAKVLAKRLKKVVGKVISHSQNVFVVGGQIGANSKFNRRLYVEKLCSRSHV